MPLDKPSPVLRVGVTGARKLNPEKHPMLEEKLRERIEAVLLAIRNEASQHGNPPEFQLLSPLAEGADRLVATLALEHDYSLVCPLPFAPAVYEKDFANNPSSVTEFCNLLARSEGRVLALDGAHETEADRTYAYEAVGRLIVRNTDLIVGIWDGQPSALRGGTAEIINFAARKGPPVIWIHATNPSVDPVWIEDEDDIPRKREGVPQACKPRGWRESLEYYVGQLLDEPKCHAKSKHSNPLYRICSGLHGELVARKYNRPGCGRAPTPAEEFLNERSKPVFWLWRTHGVIMRCLAGGRGAKNYDRSAPSNEQGEPKDLQAFFWYERFRHADKLAGEHACRYRSSYVLAFLFGAAALVSAAAKPLLVERYEWLAYLLELVFFVGILILIALDGFFQWQRRAIEYRLLAELCRKQQALAPLTWVLPGADTSVGPPTQGQEDGVPERSAWVVWILGAWLRCTPLPYGIFDAERVRSAADAGINVLVKGQIAYHEARKTQAEDAGHRLEMLSFWLFVPVPFALAARLFLLARSTTGNPWLEHGVAAVLDLLCEVLPACSAALFGIRAYGELEWLAEQSQMMLDTMRRAEKHVEALMCKPAGPLDSQLLGHEIALVASRMMEDLRTWDLLFRAKILDT